MNTKNKIISIFMCLCIAMLSGCSQDSGGETVITPAATPANTSAAENAGNGESSSDAVTTEDNAADTSSDEAVTTEAENRPSDELFAYYDLLSAEYKKCGKLYTLTDTRVTVTGTGKIIGNDYSHLSVYDVEKKAITAGMNTNYDMNIVYYMDDDNGYFYTFGRPRNVYTHSKYDSSGNLIAQIETDSYIGRKIMPDGTLFSRSDGAYNYNMYSSDWQTKTELPILQAEVEHGLKKDIYDYVIVASYGNKVYAYSFDNETTGYYCLNTDTMTWSAVESELNETFPSYEYDGCGYISWNEIIGRYLFVQQRETDAKKVVGKIYDMETDTVIATISDPYFGYGGRNYSLDLKFGVLTQTQYPGDGSEAIIETILDTEDKQLQTYYGGTDTICPLDEQYYVYVDKYGIFLREYGKDSDGEITVMLFEN